VNAARSTRGRFPGIGRIGGWQMWSLPRWLAGYIVAVVAAAVVTLALAAGFFFSYRVHDLIVLAALLSCSAATVELTRRAGENSGSARDVYAVWNLPVAVLMPVAYVPLVLIVGSALTQWRVRRAPLHRRVFSVAAVGLSYVAAALVFHALMRLAAGAETPPTAHALTWMIVLALCAAIQWAVNAALVMTAVKGSVPAARYRDLFARESVYNDVAGLCAAVLVTFCVANTVIALVFAFPLVTLLQRSLRHAQLLSQSRTDSKTGLLNAATWERAATAEVARAARTGTPVAVALLDLDRFKSINDTHGHLTGDQVLKEVARTLNTMLRQYDLAGRFGGEEFALLLPHTSAVDAFRIAERVRSMVAGLRIIAPGAAGAERVAVTVSIGVAALDKGDQREFSDLLAAADAALYRAKAQGRDQVQMISTTRGLSAVSGLRGEQPPPAFRRAVGS
jgi:diguanylate cyclase (GGDEF)-like protein